MKPLPPTLHHTMLTESITRFLTQYRNGVVQFNHFTSIFSRALHSLPNPPLHLLWFYSALEFHSLRLQSSRTPTPSFLEPSRTSPPPLSPSVTNLKDLFQLLVSCSSTCGSTKRIAALAPLLSQFHRLLAREKGLVKSEEAQGLIEGIVGYCSLACSDALRGHGGDDDEVVVLDSDFVDLIRVWMVDDEESGSDDRLRGFFPLVSEGLLKEMMMMKSGCEVGFLAGVVMCQALLLKLCSEFEPCSERLELEKKLQGCAVQTIAGFRNFYFLDILFRMMLEPVLPVISLLGSENSVLLKDVLLNSVMMIEYSFINPQAGVSLHSKNLKDVAVTWLFVSDLAIQSAREKGDHGKAMSHVNAFSRSCIPDQLINWVTSQIGITRKISRPNVSTPIVLIKWLLDVQDQGLAVFGGANHRAKANFFTSRSECMLPVIKHFFNNLDRNVPANSINGGPEPEKPDGDIEMVDSLDVCLADDDNIINTPSTDGTRKRKEWIEDETKMQLKFMRCHQFQENSVRENSFVFRQQ
ncbi:hypothetical protein PIB30_051491 [Stylosanthes scabra]|uniref:Uncharacterized protein n=1 Tax=Stylosanthes scabra TaxID=79078 RepID=A0ABU6ZGR2_9FABA|nr:hypothetical protein [Stylosanthes scabra]